MESDLELLRRSLDRIVASDEALAEEIGDLHPGVAAELPSIGAPETARAPVDPAMLLGEMETIVRTRGRPVLTICRDDFLITANDVDSQVWRTRLEGAREVLRSRIPSVGRVEVQNDPSYTWVGTAWLVAEDIVVTNRHVASEFAYRKGETFVYRTAPGFTAPMASSVDFLQEDGRHDTRMFLLREVLYIESDPGPDLAFLRVEPQSGDGRPGSPIPLAARAPEANQFIAAIGYPARDSRVPDQDLVTRIFGNIYDKKRLAPGTVLEARSDVLVHDCSTLGGNSGSALIDMSTGEAVGLHWAGLFLQGNYAVPSAIVRDRLDRVLKPVKHAPGPPRIDTAPKGRHQPQSSSTGQSPTLIAGQGATLQAGQEVTWMIPISVTVRLGSPTTLPAPKGSAAANEHGSVDEAVEELKRQLAGREDVVAVRAGYRFVDGWITDESVVVVAVKGHAEDIPESALGVPVEVTPASPWDFLEAAPQLESLERVPVTHYTPPAGTRLEPVNEPMRIVCHVSPDAGWPTLKTFLAGTTERLTIGMYDFTAPHIIAAVKSATKKPPRRLNLVIQRGSATEGTTKANDIPDETVVRDLSTLLKTRFDQSWASVSGPNRLFASAYHIKVAVRDGKALWLSSGNWQSTNQPDIDPVGGCERSFTPLRGFNREWHVIVESPALAEQFERFLLFDLQQARAREEVEAVTVETPMAAIPAELFAEAPETEAEAAAVARYFPPLVVERRLRIMPLLTPDNFQQEVLELVNGARKRICFQNQSLNPLLDSKDDEGFFDLVTALRNKQKELGDVRIIIRGDFSPRPVLERLKALGFDMAKVRAQKKCHTKGLVVDSSRVVIGSHNWTNQGTLVNRDASLIVHDAEIAKYYEKIFEFDWHHLARPWIDPEVPPVRLLDSGQEAPAGMVKVPLRELLLGDG